MSQLQLPLFPAGVTEINHRLAVQTKDGQVFYIHGHLPVFHHKEDDLRSFRMFTSQLIDSGTAKPREIAEAFGVPMVTVKRYVKLYRARGSRGFYAETPRHSSASVLKGPVLEQAQQLLDEARSVPEVAAVLNVLPNTLHKAIRAGRLRAHRIPPGLRRSARRRAAGLARPVGSGVAAPEPGVLPVVPSGFYGMESIFRLLGLMALARVRSLEQLRFQAPGEWGKLLGLDRIPEVRTLRAKLKLLCQDPGRAMEWNTALAQEWIARQSDADLYFYCDGHVRV